ncbi:lipopolysaccharide biosynthesis protein [Actinosynnema sp. NPDC059335]|uniref:lipopolysaccharide biosynthesis protein n=1 Tax=Actinosynnema sp. NPDC059335 TaxID=3346804 RepID=UPI00367332C6
MTGALLVASVFGYGLMILCGRVLGPADYKVFLAFWGLIFGLGSAISPVEQEVSRLAAQAELDGRRTGPDALRTVGVAAVLVALFGLVLFIPPVNERLFDGHAELVAITVCGGLGYVVLYGVRGLLIGHRRIPAYAGITVVEPTVRVALAVLLVVVGLAGIVPLAVAVAAGVLAWVVFTPVTARLLDRRGPGAGWRPVTRTTLQLMAGSTLTATVVTGFPAMVSLLAPAGDPAVVGAFLSALTLARFPLVALLPVQALAVPAIVRLSATADGRRRLHGWLLKGVVGVVVVGVVGAAAGAAVGPWLVRLVYGQGFVVAGWAVAGLVFSSVLLAGVQLLAAVLLARGRAGAVLRTWAATAAPSLAVLAWWPADTVVSSVLGLVVGPAVGVLVGFVAVWRRGGAG